MDNKIMNKLTAMQLIKMLEYDLALEEFLNGNDKNEALCDSIKYAIKNIKEYHNID